MRVLLITYEFPPIESAQSLRWHYLSNELVRQRAEITVLTPAIVKPWIDAASGGINILRSFPGPYVGGSAWLARRLGKPAVSAANAPGPVTESGPERVYRKIRELLDIIVFPDVRTEWYPFARRQINRLDAGAFDVVIAAHEPGVDLLLGLKASRQLGLPLIIDLADPLVTPYSPAWRRRLDRRLERRACRHASGIITTTSGLARQLIAEHGLDPSKVTRIEQGFAGSAPEPKPGDARQSLPADGLWLLFTGNFYADFRNPDRLLEALQQTPDITLVHAGFVPDWLEELFRPLGDQVRCLGRLSHDETLALQRSAPVLLSLGNRQALQEPGKIYEYFGAGRPILHVAQHEADPQSGLITGRRRGLVVANETGAIAGALGTLRNLWQRDALEDAWDLGSDSVSEFSWDALGNRLYEFLRARVASAR